MKTIDRLEQFLTAKKISQAAFDAAIGAGKGYIGKQIKNSGSVGSDILEKIFRAYPELNIIWLITGTGEMLNTPSSNKKEGFYKIPEGADSPSSFKKNYTKTQPLPAPDADKKPEKPSDIKGFYYILDGTEKPSEHNKISKTIYSITPVPEGENIDEVAGSIDISHIATAVKAADVLQILSQWMAGIENDIEQLKKGKQ
ncbi:MAG: hypothetical protein ACK4EY_14590 [Flavipsychrobacter sp.]